MVADSVRLTVVKKIQAALLLITGGSFAYPIADASQVSIDPADTVKLLTGNDTDLPFYVVETTPSGTKTYYPADELVEKIQLNVHARYDAEPNNLLSRVSVAEGLIADIERALTADITLGGTVYDTRILVAQSFVGVGTEIVIVTQPIECRVYRQYGAP